MKHYLNCLRFPKCTKRSSVSDRVLYKVGLMSSVQDVPLKRRKRFPLA